MPSELAPYRAPLPELPDPYPAAWADLRRRRLVLSVVAVSFAPALGVVQLLYRVPVLGLAPLIFGGSVLCGLAHKYLTAFRCPRCRGQFQARWLGTYTFAKGCTCCGLRFGAPQAFAQAPEGQPLTQSMRVAADISGDAEEVDDDGRPTARRVS